jgi:hypothetical protein
MVMVRKAAVNATRQQEIVEEIVDNLRPLKSGISVSAASERVRQEIEDLHETDDMIPKLATGKEFRMRAKELEDALAKLDALLNSAPTALACYLFRPWPAQSFSELYYALDSPLPFGSADEIERACFDKRDELVADLTRLRKECAQAAKAQLGPHPNYDHSKHVSAYVAWCLLTEWSEHKATGTADGAYRTIASLLYEAGWGIGDADLKRACDDVLNRRLP